MTNLLCRLFTVGFFALLLTGLYLTVRYNTIFVEREVWKFSKLEIVEMLPEDVTVNHPPLKIKP